MSRRISPRRSRWSTADRRVAALCALLAYIPMVLTRPGAISADTKTYLTLDPARLLGRAWSMWDPWVGAGTVTHQNIGYLFPLGPIHLGAERLGVPDWLTQRLIWGTIVWAAAWGTWRLLRWLGWSGTSALIATVAYAWSPYLLSYLARLSVILMAWAALPWLIRYAAMAVRAPHWRAPALAAAVIALVGSVNASALVLVLLGPVLWVAAEWWAGRHRARAVIAGAARTAVLTLAVSLWWMAGLWVQGSFGMPILDFTETYTTVAASSTAQEILRGLGYWFFYGGDRLDPWVGPAAAYLSPWMIALGTVLAAGSLVGLCLQFPARRSALTMWAVGLMVAVGAAPLSDPSLYGRGFLAASSSTLGMALRSTPRAAPLVLLAMAMGLGALGGALAHWAGQRVHPAHISPAQIRVGVTAVVVLALGVQMFPWFTGRVMTEGIIRPSALPDYRTELATWLDAHGNGRVWEIPGSDFASYRWGGTVDPVLPGMIDRPTLARELVPQGGPGTASLLAALDTRLHEGTFEPESLRAVARLLGVSTIVMRADLQHERYRLVRPGSLWPRLLAALGPPDHMGPMTTDQPVIPMIDEILLADALRVGEFPIVAAWNLTDAPGGESPVQVLTATSDLVAGDGEGLVDLAAAGLLATDRPVLLAAHHTSRALWAADGGAVVVTDTNARRARRWSTLGAHSGVIEAAGEVAVADDPADRRLDLFPGVGDEMRTVRVALGEVVSVTATSYGNRFAHTPEDAAHFALDGDPTTAWRTGVFADLRGEQLRVVLAAPVTVDHIHLLQPTTRVVTRFVTRVAVHFDSGIRLEVDLDERSRAGAGQRIEIPEVPFSTLTVELLADNLGRARSYRAQPGAGIAELQIGERRADTTVEVPTGWLTEIPDLAARPLGIVLTRLRIDPAIPNRADPEPRLDRRVALPAAREFSLAGTARLHSGASDLVLGRALGVDAPAALATERLAGGVHTWGGAAIDGDHATAWVTPFERDPGGGDGPRVVLRPAMPVVGGKMVVHWRADAEHSEPSQLRVRVGDGLTRVVDVDPNSQVLTSGGIPRRSAVIELTDLPVAGAPEEVTLEIAAIRARSAPDYISGVLRTLPVAVTEIDFLSPAGTAMPWPTLTGAVPGECRADLVRIDGRQIPVRLLGETGTALARGPIGVVGCEPVTLGPGPQRIETTDARLSGLDLDRLVFTSAASQPVPAGSAGSAGSAEPAGHRAIRVSSTRHEVTLEPSAAPRWLVLRESHNPGWNARIDGGPPQPPTLIDGWANGWLIPAADTSQVVVLDWAPQRIIAPALILSGAAGLVVLILGWRRRTTLPTCAVERAGPPRRRPGRGRWTWVGTSAFLLLAGGAVAVVAHLAVAAGARRVRWLAPAVAFSLWGVAALFTAAVQFGYRVAADPDWPSRFAWVNPVVWAAVAAVLAHRPTSEEDRPAQ